MAEAAHCCPHGQNVHSQIAAIFRIFFVREREGEFLCQGAGRGLFARAAQKAPCVYRIPLGPHVLCGHSREFCEKRGFRKIPLRGGGHPGRQHIPPTPPASPVEPERGQGGLARNFETPQITESAGLEKRLLDYPQSGVRKGRDSGEFFSSGSGVGNFFVRGRGGKFLRQGAGGGISLSGRGGGLFARAAQKASPPSPPTPPASPVEPERGRGGVVWNFETPQITERVGLEKEK